MAKSSRKTFVRIITWIIIILMVLAIFSPFIGYIFDNGSNQNQTSTTSTPTDTAIGQ